MLEHMKKPRIELRFTGPPENRDKAITALKNLGFVNVSETVSWRELFPEYRDEELPGVCLAGARHREGLTQRELSEMTGISRNHISAMENARMPIGKERAKILAKALSIGYKVLLQ